MATVLIVDDDTDIRATVREALEEAGHAVREAQDGEEAFALLRDDPERMVALIDLRMPNVDGFALLSMVSENEEIAHRHAYVLFSADSQSSTVVQALRSATVVTSLAKPFEIETLLGAVSEAEATLGEDEGAGENGVASLENG